MRDSMSAGVGPIAMVREGMTVVDAAGEEVGTVEFVSMGDPGAVTTEGNELHAPNDIITAAARAISDERTEPDVGEPIRSRLIRKGFVKIEGSGLFGTDRYVGADRIAGVLNDAVQLTVTKDRLPVED